MRTAICTVGTSVLGNFGRLRNKEETPEPDELLRFLHESDDLIEACAETNSLTRLGSKDKLQPGDRLVFLHSETPEGRLCGDALAAFYQLHGYETESMEIPGLSYHHKDFRNRGLKALVNTLVELLERYTVPGQAEGSVMIVATGGFKAESAYATVTGLTFGVPVYYVHERFEDVVEIPSLPISWDMAVMVDYEDLFAMLDGMPEEGEWDKFVHEWQWRRRPAIPAWLSNLIIHEDGIVCLSPAGDLLYRGLQRSLHSVVDPRVKISPQALRYLQALDPAVKGTLERGMQKLLVPQMRVRAESKHNSDLLAYPVGKAQRIIFLVDEDEVVVCEICSHHDATYERLLDQGIWRRDYQDVDFQEYRLPGHGATGSHSGT